MLDLHDDVRRPRRALVLAAIATAILSPDPVGAACNPASCDAVFACGFRECIDNTCMTFPEPAGSLCRAAAGVCDRAETCNGSSVNCPSDVKRNASTICRPAVDECDGAETCDGVSNACTAPDVGVAPQLSEISIVDGAMRLSTGEVNPNRFFEVRISGEQLCEATVDVDSFFAPFPLVRISSNLLRNTAVRAATDPVPNSTVHFDINRGAVAGSIPFVAADPDGIVEILSPAFGATLGGNPSFTVSNQCTNCSIQQLEVIEDGSVGTLDTILTALPVDTPVGVGLDDFAPDLAPLPESRYVFEAEAIAGSLVAFATLENDPTQTPFDYLSGRSIRNRLRFDVPEPAASGAGAIALVALLGLGRLRRSSEYRAGRWRRRGRAAGIGSALDLRLRELRAGRGALGAATRRRAGLAPTEDAVPALLSRSRARPRRVQG
jgi:hypothetical protein